MSGMKVFQLYLFTICLLMLSGGCASSPTADATDRDLYDRYVKTVRTQIREDPLIGIWQGSRGGRQALLAVFLNNDGGPEKLKAVILNGDEYAMGFGNEEPWFYVSPLAQRGVYAGKAAYKPFLWKEWFPTRVAMKDFNQFVSYDDLPAKVKSPGGKTTSYLRKEPRMVAIDNLLRSGGSGFLLWNSAYVVTANHVLGRLAKISVRFADGAVYAAAPVAREARMDLAVLKLDGFSPSPERGLRIDRASSVVAGEAAHAIGYPLGAALSKDPSIVSGQVSATSGIHDAPHQFRLTAPINPGNSGGPIFNSRGAVVGVALAVIRQPKIEGVAFGIKIGAYLSMLDRLSYGFSEAPAEPMGAEDVFRSYARDVVFVYGEK